MPKIGGDHKQLHAWWQEILDSGQFTEGKFVRLLEEEVSDFYQQHAIAVNSAGTGLYTILRCLGFTKSQCIAVPNNTFLATGSMAAEVAGVCLVDANRQDFSMSFQALEALKYRPDAVIYTHVGGGLGSSYAKVAAYCNFHSIPLVEDAAHALGTTDVRGIRAGAHGIAAVFSLYPTKALPAGEGGIIITRSQDLAEKMRRFRNYGKFGSPVQYDQRFGFNFRMDEWTAAVALHQWRRMPQIMYKRAQAADRLSRVIAPMVDWDGATNWYKYIAPFDPRVKKTTGKVYSRADQLSQAMQYHYEFPNSDWIAENHICLPLDEDAYTGMTSAEIEEWLLS